MAGLTSISNKAFNGQLGSSQQTSDIEMGDSTSINLRRGSGVIELHCQNNNDKLELYSDGYGGYRDLACRTVNFTGTGNVDGDLTYNGAYNAKLWAYLALAGV